MDMRAHGQGNGSGERRTVGNLVFWGFALIACYFLLTEHRAHLFGVLPYLLVLACPLMHVLHHHNGRGMKRRAKPPTPPPDAQGSGGAPPRPDH